MTTHIDPAQLRPLKCPFCLSNLFERIEAAPILQDRLNPESMHYTPGLAFRCAGCMKLFDPKKAAKQDQEIFTP